MCATVKEEIVFEEIEIEESHDLNNLMKQEIKQEEDLEYDEVTHQCDQCCTVFKNKIQLTGHIMQVHNEGEKTGDVSVNKEFMHATEKPFQCEVCPKGFVTARLLQSHLRVHSSKKPYLKCGECDKMFKYRQYLYAHKKRAHATERPFQCEKCPKSFPTAGILNTHLRIHTVDTPFKCDRCSEAFNRPYPLAKHKAKEHGDGGDFACEECGRRFLFSNSLKTHRLRHTGEKNIQCGRCEKKFDRKIDLNCHKKYAHAAEKDLQCNERNKCDECDKTFKTAAVLVTHKISVHATERPFQCEVCPKSFPTARILKIHSKNHIVDTPYKCDQCSEAFNRPYALAKHKAHNHGNGGDFPCEVCGKRFLFSNSLKVHLLRHTGEYNVNCDRCDKKFKTKSDLHSHKEYSHVHEGTLQSSERIIKCDKCDKMFKSTRILAAHKLTLHATDRPFQCEVCHKSFLTARAFKIHLKNHRVGTTYRCDQCSEAFNRPYALAKHKAHEHGTGGDFPCKVCGKRFLFSSSLKVHLLRHTGEYNINCDRCDKKFKTKGDLHSHKEHSHVSEETLQSSESIIKCDKMFNSTKKLAAHKLTPHATERPSQCEVCPKGFPTARAFKIHLKNHGVETPYKCDQCSEAFNTPYSFAKHKAHEHGNGGDFPCEKCGKRFVFSNSLKVHRLRHTDEYNIQCDQCDKKFKRKNDLRAHKKHVHATEGTFQCKSCPKSFAKAKYLKDHSKIHGAVEKLHTCGQCPKAFDTPCAFAKHKVHEHGGSETFDDVDVKEEPVELYDPEMNQVVSELKYELEEKIDLDVKQEPEDIDERL